MTQALKKVRSALKPTAGWVALLAALALSAIGINAIGTSPEALKAADQARWLLIAFPVMLLVMVPHPRWLSLMTWPLLIIVTVMLTILIIPGVPNQIVHPRHGARSWINLYFMDFQPSELAKILFVMALARYMRFRENYRTLLGLLVPFLIMFIPVALIICQPDPGTALLFVPAMFAILVAAGARLSHIWWLLGLAALFVVVNVAIIFLLPERMQVLRPHQRNRIISVLSLSKQETRYVKSTAFQQDTAMNLIGAGGLTGYSHKDAATLVDLNGLPEGHNDMAFAIIVNRWGLLGGLTVLGLYFIMLGAMLLVAARSKDPFVRLTTVGFVGLIGAQITVNIGMNLGLMPIIGITLPFISYGGSSLVASFIMIGMVLNFASRRAQILARPSFEFDNSDTIFQ